MKSLIDISKIREQLPHGAQTEIAKNANVHLNLVHRVLSGKSNNIKVINAIADYLKDFNNQKDKAIKRLSELIS